jgi:hypothetical protein
MVADSAETFRVPIRPEIGARSARERGSFSYWSRLPGRTHRAGRSGTRSTGYRIAARSRRRSGRRGPSVAGRRSAGLRSGPPKPGCAISSTRSRRGTLPRGDADRVRRSRTPPSSGCRERKPSTLNDYRSALKAHLLPAFGEQPLESITAAQIDQWRRGLTGLSAPRRQSAVSPRARAAGGGGYAAATGALAEGEAVARMCRLPPVCLAR